MTRVTLQLTALVFCLISSAGYSLGCRAESYDLGMAAELTQDRAELARTWDQAWINIPRSDVPPVHVPVIGPLGSDYVQRFLESLPAGVQQPTVVFLHGCSGIRMPERRLEKILTRMGYAVIFPNSLARTLRPSDCDVTTGAWGRFPLVDLYRRAELLYTLELVRALPWVDKDNLFVGGFGEGAKAAALWGAEVEVSGYIIAGWTCTAPPELGWLDGLRTPPGRPVLALVSRHDPHYRWADFQGDCGTVSPGREDVTSFIVDGTVHNVFVYPETAQWLVDFMLAHTHSKVVPSQAFLAGGLRFGLAAGLERFPAVDPLQRLSVDE